jgi:DNA polymerase III subunit delta'
MSFSSIYGHGKQIGMLKKAMEQARIGQAYIFSGPDAIGKKTLALAFAQALNCERADQIHDACGLCLSCRKISHGSHPDIHLLQTQAQFIRIDEIRSLQAQMTFKPLEGKKRIMILDDADKMNEQAANALLKTLEEPSANNLLLLVTSRPYWLPQTILSRCRHVRFNPLSADIVASFLREKHQMETSKAVLLASLSGGSIGRALESDSEDTMAFRTKLRFLLNNADRRNPLSLLLLASYLGQDKKEIAEGLKILNTYFRDALVYKETACNQMVINADDLPSIASMAQRLQGEEILNNIQLVEIAQQALEMNVNKSLTLETMAFKLRL